MSWHQITHGGHQHWVYQQQKSDECAIACMLIALQRRNKLSTSGTLYRKKRGVRANTQKQITAGELRDASSRFGGKGHYKPGLVDAGVRTDQTVSGQKRSQQQENAMSALVAPSRRAMTIQYHPEASPGPHDADICFKQYIDMMAAERQAVPV